MTPEFTVGKLQISLSAQGDTGTSATIAYEFTSLGPLGDAYLEGFTAQWYEKFMQVWEGQMNHYLETGELIPTPDLQSGGQYNRYKNFHQILPGLCYLLRDMIVHA